MMRAKQGDARSQYYLAGLCLDGKGVPKDLNEAVKWYRRAAEQRYEPAKRVLDRLK
ncbi:hypothetical protein ACFL2Q_12900 [Thermodesulfobacteriota bacterium]